MGTAVHLTAPAQQTGLEPRSGIVTALLVIAVAVVTLCLFRVFIWLDYRPAEPLPWPDVAHAFWMGARFDAKSAAALCVLALLLTAPLLVLKRWSWGGRLLSLSQTLWVACILGFINLFALINHYFIDFYGHEINVLIFGFFEDDTEDIMASVWNDYPLPWLILLWIALTALGCRLVLGLARYLSRATGSLAWRPRCALLFCGLAVILVLGRGSVSRFPLRDMHLTVSSEDFVNTLVPNGPYALSLAIKARRADRIRRNPIAGIERYGFETLDEVAAAYGIEQPAEDALVHHLYRRTPEHDWLQRNPPHVVVVLMEAFGRHILDYDRPDNNVLGRFSQHAKEDYLFRNAVSITHGTHPTLEGLLFNTPISPLAQASYRRLASFAARPYGTSGYRTIFLTSGPANWRQMDGILRTQGFDQVFDSIALKKRYPGITESTWGVPDEHMFRYALELLAEADAQKQPVFLFMLSTSNHTPYDVHQHSHLPPVNLSAFDGLKLSRHAPLDEILKAYQYAADQLGGFLDRLKSGPLAARTLVAATGDHSTRHFVDYESDYELLLEYGVPIYFYLPPAYAGDLQFDPERFASHRDIFPTLYPLSLSQACYFASGENLFGAEGTHTALAGFTHAISREGAVSGLNRQSPVFRHWQKPFRRLDPRPLSEPSAAMLAIVKRERAYSALLDWHIRMQIISNNEIRPPCESESLAQGSAK
jgi:phosphoglycerol transferase MdoB-like AlkP superfamily enzyme